MIGRRKLATCLIFLKAEAIAQRLAWWCYFYTILRGTNKKIFQYKASDNAAFALQLQVFITKSPAANHDKEPLKKIMPQRYILIEEFPTSLILYIL